MQEELDFSEPIKQLDDEVAALAVYLKENGIQKAKEITEALGFDERKVRELASRSHGVIVSGPGCKGYKHVLDCTQDEIREVTARLRHQANKMAKRAGDILKAAHQNIGS